MKGRIILCLIFLFVLCASVRAQIIIPVVADGPNWQTRITFLSISSQTTVTLAAKFYRSNGMPWSDLQFSYDLGGGTKNVEPDGTFETTVRRLVPTTWVSFNNNPIFDKSGWMILDVDPASVIVFASLEKIQLPPDYRILARAGVLDSPIGIEAIVPFNRDTAIATVNPGTSDLVVRLTANCFSVFGSAISSPVRTITLKPRESIPRFVTELFTLPGGFHVGSLQILSVSGGRFASLSLDFSDQKIIVNPVKVLR